MAWTCAIVIGLLVVISPRDAAAWGPDGHRIVCRIAFQLLDAPRQQEIIRLTASYRRPNNGSGFPFFTDGCVFADEARSRARQKVPGWHRFDPFDAWHFLNIPRTTRLVSESQCQGNCVLTGIARHADQLSMAAADADRAEALFFLGHWVGDVHQPLHVSYSDDRGGNDVTPIGGGFFESDSLHGVWDSGLLIRAIGAEGWRPFADRQAQAITPAEHDTWLLVTPLAWAQESYNLATAPATQYCRWRLAGGQQMCAVIARPRTLLQPYQDEFRDDIAQRLQQAGARLADLLRRHLRVP